MLTDAIYVYFVSTTDLKPPPKKEVLEQEEHKVSFFYCFIEFMMCSMNENMNCYSKCYFCTFKVIENLKRLRKFKMVYFTSQSDKK